MQQTETYKLNLLESTDPFSPAPLNENAQKAEAQFAALHAADARHCLDKLAGPLSPEAGGNQVAIDLSGIDITQYRALLLFFVNRATTGDVNLYCNGREMTTVQSTGVMSPSASSSGGGYLILVPAAELIFMHGGRTGRNMSGSHITGVISSCFGGKWEEVESFMLKPFSPNSEVSLYGVRV